ncbi:MAG: hypothetical protein IPL73_25315 [Candidatus Obscuribacter sp.]|nr:hypothetical protein [Candidatus Obscuribacter sp.]
MVYDGDVTAGVSQSGFVITGHAPTELLTSTNQIYLATDVTPPTLTSATVNGNQLVLSFSEAIDGVNCRRGRVTWWWNVNGTPTVVTGGSGRWQRRDPDAGGAGSEHDVVTFSYTDPTAGNDVNALQDLAGNDAASVSGFAVVNATPSALTPRARYCRPRAWLGAC